MKNKYLIILMIGLFSSSCSINENLTLPNDVQYVKEDGQIPNRITLDQDWNKEVQMKFWYTSQGSQILPYSWFTWLEQTDNKSYFRNAQHMESFGYLPDSTSKYNPSGLPIGFAMTLGEKAKDAHVGFTCAACHTNQINYKDNKYLIDGAPTLANFVSFFIELIDALNETYRNDEKFKRFSKKVLAGSYSSNNALELRSQLLERAIQLGQRRDVNDLPSDYPSDFTSYARLDAFGNIENAGSAFALKDLKNKNFPSAPVSYPFLWGTHQSDYVQWNASAPNTPVVGPIIRNIGEVVGVFGGLSIDKASWLQRLFGKEHVYNSTADFHGLGALEGYVKTLRSPQWSETNLPLFKPNKLIEGEQLYKDLCASCHQVVPRAQEGVHYKCVKTPLDSVGTDIETAWQIENHFSKTLFLEGCKAEIIVGEKFGDTTRSLDISANGIVGVILKNPIKFLEAGIETSQVKEEKSWKEHVEFNSSIRDSILERTHKIRTTTPSMVVSLSGGDAKNIAGLVYKARPLNGIWATAPYLHNGSIPNLWELLKEPSKRKTSFWVGGNEYDPVNVGFKDDHTKSEFKVLDANHNIMPGNSNRGHIYGTNLTDDEKWALVEYMKTL